jgi:pyruvate/2-oxoglutarate dehydrogenase complex dihydrolipoamide acyltransferase (E2) component
VAQGDVLVVVESMKLEHSLGIAARDGVVASVAVEPGQQVAPGQVLVRLEAMNAPLLERQTLPRCTTAQLSPRRKSRRTSTTGTKPAPSRARCTPGRSGRPAGLGYPEALGGMPAPYALRNAVSLALSRHCGSGGLLASLFSHNIGLPPVLRHGSEGCSRR